MGPKAYVLPVDHDVNRSEAQAALDQLDDLILGAKAIPLTTQVRIDRMEILTVLDRLRVALGLAPDEPPG
jgi:hypothetical protein